MRLLERADLLSEFPELGTSYRKRKNVRRLRCDPYFIYYRVRREGSVIEVMGFLAFSSSRTEPLICFASRRRLGGDCFQLIANHESLVTALSLRLCQNQCARNMIAIKK